MDERSIESMSLRDQLRYAERVCHELADHLERGFAPKAESLARLIRPTPNSAAQTGVQDVSLYHSADSVLSSHEFTKKVLERFRELLKAIDVSMHKITG